jgi:hypothetical protein
MESHRHCVGNESLPFERYKTTSRRARPHFEMVLELSEEIAFDFLIVPRRGLLIAIRRVRFTNYHCSSHVAVGRGQIHENDRERTRRSRDVLQG